MTIMKAKIIVTLYIKNVAGALYTTMQKENALCRPVSPCVADNQVYSSSSSLSTVNRPS